MERVLEVLKQKFQSPTLIVEAFLRLYNTIRIEALFITDENWRLISDGWVSSPWASLGGPIQCIIKYIIY